MDTIARRPAERTELFQEAAARRGVDFSIIEKDFWVCWVLKRLFDGPKSGPSLLFKGGTSLSKVFGVIDGFSEDIDLSLDRHDLGFKDQQDPENAPSQKRAKQLLEELFIAAVAHVRDVLLPRLESKFIDALGDSNDSSDPWRLSLDPEDPLLVLYSYPVTRLAVAAALPSYVKPVVRLEFGARSDHWPASIYEVTPYAAEEFRAAFKEPTIAVKTLEAERTFWEKSTIIHAEFHRETPRIDRMSRHYYDLAMMARSSIREKALTNLELLDRVAKHKKRFFRASWARYDLARPGTLRLMPHDEMASGLRRDYRRMRDMFLGEPPTFDDVLKTVGDLELEINGLASPQKSP